MLFFEHEDGWLTAITNISVYMNVSTNTCMMPAIAAGDRTAVTGPPKSTTTTGLCCVNTDTPVLCSGLKHLDLMIQELKLSKLLKLQYP